MGLLVDSDAFCKLAIGGVLEDALALFGADVSSCHRLPALPHMLRRGRLRKTLGDAAADSLIPLANAMPILPQSDAAWLDRLTHVSAIDPGEAQLFAVAAKHEFLVLSGDKRALLALKDIHGFPLALQGRIAVIEAVLLALCKSLGPEILRQRLQPVLKLDKMIGICFSPGNSNPPEALESYYKSMSADVVPLELWKP
jgi:hypothetical protein